MSVTKHDEVNMTRFVLQFNRLPEYLIKTSGQRLEINLADTFVAADADWPRTDERLVQMLVGQAKDKLVLSFLLRRPPHFVNGTKDENRHRITIDVHWQQGQKGTRPAIASSVLGQPSVMENGGVISRSISSKYRGRWLDFFTEYESSVKLSVPLTYTNAPFPCLALFENVDGVLPLEVQNLAQQREWKLALLAMDNVGLDGTQGANGVRLLLVRADIQCRAGKVKAARRYLRQASDAIDELAKTDEALSGCLELQQAYVASVASASPYEVSAELDAHVHRYPASAQLYFDLLQAEVAIAVGDVERCRALLDAGMLIDVGSADPYYRLRRADLIFLRGDMEGAVEQYAAVEELFQASFDAGTTLPPFSLANYAVSLYRTQQYAGAIEKIKQLMPQIAGNEERDMARYIMALALLHSGELDAGYDLLHQIATGTVGASLAKGKIADMGMQTTDIYSRRRALQEYADLGAQWVDRQLRAEMQFKHALALHIMGDDLAAIDELDKFLRIDHLSSLRAHAQALLAELLPPVIHQLVADEEYYAALLTVEKNRDLLVATSRDFGFLIELGQVFTQMEYAESAERLYLYLLDVNDVGDKQEQVYAPLLMSLMKLGNYAKVIEYAQRYFSAYPQGENRAAVFLLQLQAMLAQEDVDAVMTLLRAADRPQSKQINRLAAKLAWEGNLLSLARQNIDAVVGDDFSSAAPEDQLLQAEIMLLQGEPDAALLRYRNLDSLPEFAEQANYREASILLQQGQRRAGLKLLQQLVDTGNEGPWCVLAQETLKIERFDR
ncbi:MAG: hypothetical protein RBR22_12685 [Desulfuromonas sp.]|nr:hypothetical protein [Desulfuromonas sp.]